MPINKIKSALAAAGLAAAIAAPVSAQAAPIELALVLDASASISASNWSLQTGAYANALTQLALNGVLPTDGTVAISVIRFAETASVVRGMTTISDSTDLTALTSFFTGLSQSGNGMYTCISCGIQQAVGTFTTATSDKERRIVDVSTDGVWNRGANPAGDADVVGTSAWAVVNGNADVVNAIGIGPDADANFNYGDGSFNMTAANFETFQTALVSKLEREITGNVPVPGTLALFGLGVLGLGLARRRLA